MHWFSVVPKAIVIFSLLITCGIPTFAAKAAGIKPPRPGETVEVLVQYAEQPTDVHHWRVTSRRGHLRAAYSHLAVAHYDVTPEALADLESNPDVVSISPNLPITGSLDRATYSANYWPLEQYYDNNNLPKTHGIGIAIVDSGINPGNTNFNWYHSPGSRIVYSQTFVGGDTNDGYGHGTHVAGIAAGVDNITSQIASPTRFFSGVAQGANIINLKVLDNNGNGTDSTVIAGINAAISLKSKYNIRILNLSRPPHHPVVQNRPPVQGRGSRMEGRHRSRRRRGQ